MTAGSTPALGIAEKQHNGSVWQLADHSRLEREMLWVQIPPEPLWLMSYVLAEQPGVLATLSRWRSGVRIPSGTLEKNGAVRKPEKAAKLKPS